MSSQRMAIQGISHGMAVMVLVLGSITMQQAMAQGPSAGENRGPANYIITFRAGTSQAQRAAAVRRAGAELRSNYSIVDAVSAVVPNANVYAALQRDTSILEIIPNREVHAFQSAAGRDGENINAKPGTGGGGGTTTSEVQPGVKRVIAGGADPSATDGAGIGVAIVDTGIDFNHRDLSVYGSPTNNAESFTAHGSSCLDDQGHGTHVSGIVAAQKNGVDVAGVAPGAKLFCVKVLNAQGSGTDDDVINGLQWVAVHATSVTPNIRVVNMSLGREGTLGDNGALRGAVDALYDAGIVVVVSAGNDSSLEVTDNVPATYPEVFAVASTTAVDGSNAGCRAYTKTIKADTASYFTTDGAFTGDMGVTISAPGNEKENISKSCFITSVGILSLKRGGGTTRMSGTSMAAPHVAGVVARKIQKEGLSGVENIRTSIRNNADLDGTAPIDSPASGYSYDGEREGIVQAP